MSEPLITECPGCHSRFRVSKGQLEIANGQVRCGTCLQVFDARKEATRAELRQRQEALHQAIAAAQAEAAAPRTSGDRADAEQTATAPSQQPRAAASGTAMDTDSEGIPHLYAEPILLDVHETSGDPVATAGWVLASLITLLLLGLQYAWFERASLALDPDLAPFYTLACETLPCDLDHSAIDQIVNERMIVRPHPAFADALSVDLRLLNRAAFAQPFPALQLSFTDLQGNPVAQRVFTPQEYLTNSDLDRHRMPPGTPVEVKLEITDPGVQALSYSLTLKPAR